MTAHLFTEQIEQIAMQCLLHKAKMLKFNCI